MADLKKDFQYFLDNKSELVKKYGGMYIVIVGCNVVGSFYSVEKYGLGNFVIQLCSENEEAYTQTYHSRVSFV